MPSIQFMYVCNKVSRSKNAYKQELVFYMQVENLVFDKDITVICKDQQGIAHTLKAKYQHRLPSGLESWCATLTVQEKTLALLPGDIQFVCRYQAYNQEFWDDNNGKQYQSSADSGISLNPDLALLNLSYHPVIHQTQQLLPISIALKYSLAAKKVIIHWTTNNWQTSTQTLCQTPKVRITKKPPENQIWSANLHIEQVFHLQYCICVITTTGELWDNHFGLNYTAQRKALSILILNLHCYQEDNQDAKFSLIAKAINEKNVDIVCLQEVAEYWNNGQGDWSSNSANIINSRLKKPYHLYTDWSHMGFDQYREGVAILSRFPIAQQESRYVSNSDSAYDINSRKVVLAQIEYPAIGKINVFSAHLSWWEGGFQEQFHNLSTWAAEKNLPAYQATLLCGDFNIAAGSIGYNFIVQANEYEDQFLSANSHGVFERIFKVNDPYWQQSLDHDYRIDYIFMHKSSQLKVISASVLFTEHDYGRVSDHCGYLMTFEPK